MSINEILVKKGVASSSFFDALSTLSTPEPESNSNMAGQDLNIPTNSENRAKDQRILSSGMVPYSVEKNTVKSQDGAGINDGGLVNGHATQEETGIAADFLPNWNPMNEDYQSHRNTYELDVDDAGVALTGYKARDESRICKFYLRGQDCWKGDYCPMEHVKPSAGKPNLIKAGS